MTTENAIFHAIEGTGREWIEYPSDSYIVKDKDNEGYFTLVFANILKDQPQLVQELKELYGSEVDIAEKWIRIEVVRSPLGKIVKQRNIVHNCTPPIIKEGFTHSLAFHGKDENYLKFIQWDANKKLEERNKLKNLDIKEEVKVETKSEEPSFKIEGSEHKGEVEIPHFLDSAKQAETQNLDVALDGVFKDMEKIMNKFFGGFSEF